MATKTTDRDSTDDATPDTAPKGISENSVPIGAPGYPSRAQSDADADKEGRGAPKKSTSSPNAANSADIAERDRADAEKARRAREEAARNEKDDK